MINVTIINESSKTIEVKVPMGSPGRGIPPGGSVGQIIVKKSVDDFDTEWGEQGSGTGTGADGKSAYEVAIDNGFTGSESEWLSSLIGERGPQGIQGPQGQQGAQGIQGPAGPVGPKGDTGETGVQGLKGDKGDPGYTPIKGVDYFDGAQGPVGPIGPKGDTGAQGVKGDTGEPGIQGVQGIKGDKGDKGDQGIQGTKGDTGNQGPQGLQGLQGIQGANGLSAYQIAVNNGFSGNESLWLESLKGADGTLTTKEAIGLGEVDNTSDLNKPISTLTQSALNGKADKAYVKVLSTDAGKNTIIGVDSCSLSSNMETVAIGYQALKNNYNDAGIQDSGKYNVSVGTRSLLANTIGHHNTAVGWQSLMGNTTGQANTGIGEDALLMNTTGTGNVAIGAHCLFQATTASANTAIGDSALDSNTTGFYNVAIGQGAGRSNWGGIGACVTDDRLTFIGTYASVDKSVNSGPFTNSTAIGYSAKFNKSNMIRLGNSSVTSVESYGNYECLANGGGVILKSPNGTRYKLTVSDSGVPTVTPA